MQRDPGTIAPAAQDPLSVLLLASMQGFTDVGSGNPGTDSSQFGAAHFAAWRPGFFGRLEAQARRASAAIGCTCGRCGAPAVVAFSGKKQFQELFASGGSGGRGRQKKAVGSAAGSPASSPGQAAVVPAVHAAAGAAASSSAAGDAAAAGGAPACSSGGGSSAEQQLLVLQARRPASIGTGRQWVLPEGWPLPLTTEVRSGRRSRGLIPRSCQLAKAAGGGMGRPVYTQQVLVWPLWPHCASDSLAAHRSPHTAGVGDDQHQRSGTHDAAAALRALAGACRAAGTGALAAAVPAALLRRPSRWVKRRNVPWRSTSIEWFLLFVCYIAALRTAPVCVLVVDAKAVVNARGAKGYACMLYNSRDAAAGSGAQ